MTENISKEWVSHTNFPISNFEFVPSNLAKSWNYF